MRQRCSDDRSDGACGSGCGTSVFRWSATGVLWAEGCSSPFAEKRRWAELLCLHRPASRPVAGEAPRNSGLRGSVGRCRRVPEQILGAAKPEFAKARRRPRHPYPEPSPGGVREAAVRFLGFCSTDSIKDSSKIGKELGLCWRFRPRTCALTSLSWK